LAGLRPERVEHETGVDGGPAALVVPATVIGPGGVEITRQVVISPKTAATHVEHIYAKLGVRSRVPLLAELSG